MENRDFKGVWIPKEIYLCEELNAIEKILLSEISSLDNENHCVAGNEYFAKFCQCSESAISKYIKHLKKLGFIEELEFDGRHRKLSVTNFTTLPSKICKAESQNLLSINIHNNTKKKDNTIINNSIRKTGKNLYQKCSDEIQAFNFSKKLQDLLYDYLSIRLKIADKPIYNVRQWTAILKKLTEELAPNDEAMQIDIVKQSIERGYASFFPVNDKQKKQTRRRVDKGVSCEQYTEEELQEIKKYQKEVLKNGGRIKF